MVKGVIREMMATIMVKERALTGVRGLDAAKVYLKLGVA